jgi:hypothetical protein
MTRAMATQTVDTPSPNGLLLWWWRKRARRRKIELAVIDLHERYGAAAYGIACNCALRGGAAEYRRFWRQVARRLRADCLRAG